TTIDLLVSVDKDQFRLHRQRPDSSCERPERGAQNIIAVNALDRPKRYSDLRGRTDFLVKFLAFRGIELLGIIKATRDSLGIENHGSRTDGSGKSPPARLIAAGNGKNPHIQSAALAPECRPQDRLVERQAWVCPGLLCHVAMSARQVASSQRDSAGCVDGGDYAPFI